MLVLFGLLGLGYSLVIGYIALFGSPFGSAKREQPKRRTQTVRTTPERTRFFVVRSGEYGFRHIVAIA